MLADELLDDARHLAAKGKAEKRKSCMRRAISTAYYAVFHYGLRISSSIGDLRINVHALPECSTTKRCGIASFTPKDKRNPTLAESALLEVITAFGQLQGDRHWADYDLAWNLVETDVDDAITLASDTFVRGRTIRDEDIARDHRLSMRSS